MAYPPKRKHRATGKKAPGGRRPGAGRPPGAKSILPEGAVSAIRAANLRLPADAHPAAAEMAQRALERLADVLDDRVPSARVFGLLKAVAMAREEVCGPLATKVEVTGRLSLEQLVCGTFPAPDEEKPVPPSLLPGPDVPADGGE